MTETDFRADSATLSRFNAAREDAIRFALDCSEAAFPEVYARFGARGRETCAEDLGYHLEFLRSALETGDVTPFVGYVTWLVQVLRSRGVPDASVARSLDDLSTFFSDRLGDDAQAVLGTLAAGGAALRAGVVASTYDSPCPERWDEAEAFGRAASDGQRRQAAALFEQAIEREGSLPRAAVHVVQPAMYDIGRRWQQNQVSVAQEHMATALSQTLLAQQMGRARPAPDNGLRALFACPVGNHHGLGLRIVADAFELEGWQADYLGTDTPMDALVNQVKATRPHLVGLSAALPQQIRNLRQCVMALRAIEGDACPHILVGGLVFNQFPNLAASVGADRVGTDAVSAAAAAAGTVTR